MEKDMNNTKRTEFVDELEVYLHNFEIEVKNCENLAVRTAYNIGMNRGRMTKEQVEKYTDLQQRFIVYCGCDKIAKKAI